MFVCVCVCVCMFVCVCVCVCVYVLGLSDTTLLAIYRDILKVSISRYFVINYRDTMPVHYCHKNPFVMLY